MDFRSFKKSRPEKRGDQTGTSENDIRKTAEKYGKKSDDELLKDILQMANQGRSEGTLSDSALSEFARKVSPMLNEEQRRRLEQVLNMIKKD